jgi:hypothetical protein
MAIGLNLVVNTSGTNLYGNADSVSTNTYYTTAGVPYGSGDTASLSQPKVVGGAVLAKISSSISALDPVTPGYAAGVKPTGPTVYRGFNNGISNVFISGALHGYKTAASGGYCSFSGIAGSDLTKVGNKVYIGPSGTGNVGVASTSGLNSLYGVHTITLSNLMNIVTDRKDIPEAPATTTKVTIQAIDTSYTCGTMTAGNYVGAKMTNAIAGVYNTTLRSMSNDPSKNGVNIARSIKSRVGWRTTKITTALRNGSFNRYLGKWTSAPSPSNDASATAAGGNTTADHAATVTPRTAGNPGPGEIVIKTGKPRPITPVLDGVWYYAVKTD